ncbi:MAG: nucleotidyl transferase AbiEii/AbiGii toxin family protein [Gordonibacter sp.]
MSKINLISLARRIAQTDSRGNMLPVIEKELLHYEILRALDEDRLLEHLTFQGGTCLRLCFGSSRYSEDLDFVGGSDFHRDDARAMKETIERELTRRYEVSVSVVEPSAKHLSTSDAIEVDRWRIKVVTAPDRPDIPQQRISLEVAAVPAHTRAIRALEVNYPELPSSYGDVLLKTETLEEICADKLKAFVTASNIRHRDLWDLRWIARQPSFTTDHLPHLLQCKIADYRQQQSFDKKLERLDDLPAIVESPEFMNQMKRFLPTSVLERTADRPLFREHLVSEVQELYRSAGAKR